MQSILIGRRAECLRVSEDQQRAAKEQYLPRIREYAATDGINADDVIVRGMLLCNSARDYYYSRFSKDALNEVAELLPGRPVQASHTYGLGALGLPLGRFFAAKMTEVRNGNTPKRDSLWVEGLFYLPNDADGQAIAKRIDLGIYKEVSIGWRCMGVTCGVCEDDIRYCGHVPGEVYDRGGMCDFEFSGVTSVIEGSLVYAGGQKNTTTFVPEAARALARGDEDITWSEIRALKRDPQMRECLREAAMDRARGDMSVEEILRSGHTDQGIRQALFAVECSKSRFASKPEASRWVRDHDFRADRAEDRDGAFRFSQFKVPDGDFAVKSVKVDEGVNGLVLRKRDKRDAGEAGESVEEILAQ